MISMKVFDEMTKREENGILRPFLLFLSWKRSLLLLWGLSFIDFAHIKDIGGEELENMGGVFIH